MHRLLIREMRHSLKWTISSREWQKYWTEPNGLKHIEGPHNPCAERPPIPYLFHFQATGVAITEVRGAGGGEDNAEGGGVRRLALNRCLLEECWFVLSNQKQTRKD